MHVAPLLKVVASSTVEDGIQMDPGYLEGDFIGGMRKPLSNPRVISERKPWHVGTWVEALDRWNPGSRRCVRNSGETDTEQGGSPTEQHGWIRSY